MFNSRVLTPPLTLTLMENLTFDKNRWLSLTKGKLFWSFLNLLQTFDRFITINWLRIWPQNNTHGDKTWPILSLFYFKLPHSLNARNLVSTKKKCFNTSYHFHHLLYYLNYKSYNGVPALQMIKSKDIIVQSILTLTNRTVWYYISTQTKDQVTVSLTWASIATTLIKSTIAL